MNILVLLPEAIKTTFTLDGEKFFEGYTFNDNWNGFACPYFEKEVADQIAVEYNGKFVEETQTYLFIDENETTESQVVYDEDNKYSQGEIGTVDGQKTVWALGSFVWTWETA
jgi:hypothetical protein